MKKAQMEILGLAIVIVLVLVATIFVVRFLVVKEPTEYRKGFIAKELASNIVNSFLKTASSSCSQLDMTELLQDCAQTSSITCDNGKNSCEYAESAAKSIFSQTLDKWNMKYEFKAYTDSSRPLLRIGQQCKAETERGLFPVPINIGKMYVELDICL